MNQIIAKRIEAVRKYMGRHNLNALYISGTDPHMGEYLCSHWKTREFLTGFTGSFGEVVITMESAGLWTDTRYFLQAEEQLEGTGVTMHKLRVPDAIPVPEWLQQNLPDGSRLGLDPVSLPLSTYRQLNGALIDKQVNLVFVHDLMEEVWADRPSLPEQPIFELSPGITGKERSEKLDDISSIAGEKGANVTVISALDDLAWTFNLRGSDIDYNPVFMGFATISKSETRLFTHTKSIDKRIAERLRNEGIILSPYHEIYQYLGQLKGQTVYLDPSTANTALWEASSGNNTIVEGASIPTLLKAVKNSVELDGFREAMRQDGCAMVNFLYWLENAVKSQNITEYTVSRKLKEFRAMQPGFMGESFSPIVGYREHGAIVHLSVDEQNALPVKAEGILLIDSGGQYTTGTTDITRTVALGPVTDHQKRDYTLVLKGMINLSMARFPAGTRGMHLDVLARNALWQHGLNYGHGTGHGVGHFLNVHEGPASIRQELNSHPLAPGMVFSNEPGIYRPGLYGIRTENMMVCAEKEVTEFGTFYGFDTLTLCPIDTRLIEITLLTAEEKDWLNNYHKRVRTELKSLVDPILHGFLDDLTMPV